MSRSWTAIGRMMRLGPGVLDAGLSSLAGFAASLYAVRFLEGPELGAFALYLSASLVGGLIPQQLVYLPAQIAALAVPPAHRSSILSPTLRWGGGLSVAVLPFVVLSGVLVSGEVEAPALVGLGVGAAVLTLVLPMQDHVRSTLYLAERPERAAMLSTCQLAVTVIALFGLHFAGTPAYWIPFGALSLGGAVSFVFGLVLAPERAVANDGIDVSPRRLFHTGRPLLPAALLQEATVFASGALLVGLTSAATLGTAEAARVVSRPVQALSLGISRSLAPRLMEAGRARSGEGARSAGGLYVIVVGAAGLAYLAVAGWSYPLSPFVEAVPEAYVRDGLVAAFVAATVLGAIAQIPRGILLGASEGTTILLITAGASLVRLAGVLLLAGAVGAYALPLAHLASLAVGGVWGVSATRSLLNRPLSVR